MDDNYPYQNFYRKIDEVMNRDNNTCQICGYYGVKSNDIIIRRCLECEKLGFVYQPSAGSFIPKPCREKGLKFRVCGECPEFKEISIEYITHSSLVVHHKDGNKKNQDLMNLITVCTSCHRSFHPRGKLLSIDEVKRKIHTNKFSF